MRCVLTLFLAVLLVFPAFSANEGKDGKTPVGYVFDNEVLLPATSVKDQYRTGTCWSFSALSFFESEMLRLGKPEVDLSEMFVVRNTYSDKAKRYVRLHGEGSFSAGGAFHDAKNVMLNYGIVPEQVYAGLNYGETKHVHGEMDNTLKQQVDAVVENKNKKLSTVWNQPVEATLDSYLGKLPESFEYEGKSYTPKTFATEFVGLNMNDYIEISSYTHHPFYSEFVLEVPDNWSWDKVYNVPLNELEAIIDNSLANGYTVAWAADVSEKGFVTSNKGVAVLPAATTDDMTDAEIAKWDALPEREKEKELYKLDKPVSEVKVTQQMRQQAFDNYETTDDHGMHIIGTAKNQDGKVFYKVKNSWGDYNDYKGYFYVSKPYVSLKTMCIMVHKDAVPKQIREKLKL